MYNEKCVGHRGGLRGERIDIDQGRRQAQGNVVNDLGARVSFPTFVRVNAYRLHLDPVSAL